MTPPAMSPQTTVAGDRARSQAGSALHRALQLLATEGGPSYFGDSMAAMFVARGVVAGGVAAASS
jgi:hypothetical protein